MFIPTANACVLMVRPSLWGESLGGNFGWYDARPGHRL